MFDDFPMGGGWGAGGLIGLSLAGDVMGGYGNWQQQQRQRDLYKKQLELNAKLQNPMAMLAGSEPYYQSQLASLKTAIPNIVRSDVAPMLGMRGIDPSGGQGQLILDQALAPYYANARTTAIDQYRNALMGGGQALQGAGGNTGMNFPGGGTGNMLQSLMMWQALQNARKPQPTQQGMVGSPRGNAPEMDFNPIMAGQDPSTYFGGLQGIDQSANIQTRNPN